MPVQKYRIETDKGAYEVEVEAPETPTESKSESLPEQLRSAIKNFATDPEFRKGFLSHIMTEEPGVIGSVGSLGLLGAASLGIPAAAAGVAGAAIPLASHLVTRGSRAIAGKPQKPVSVEEAIDIASGPALQYGGPALVRLGRIARAASPEAEHALGSVLGAVIGSPRGLQAATTGAVLGAWKGPSIVNALGTAVGRTGGALTELSPSAVTDMLQGVKSVEARARPGILRLASGKKVAEAPLPRRLRKVGDIGPTSAEKEKFKETIEAGLEDALKKIPDVYAQKISHLDEAITSAKKKAAIRIKTVRREEAQLGHAEARADMAQLRTETQAAENTDRLAAVRQARKGLEPEPPSFSASTSARTPEGATESMRQRFVAPKAPEVTPSSLSSAQAQTYTDLKAAMGPRAADNWAAIQLRNIAHQAEAAADPSAAVQPIRNIVIKNVGHEPKIDRRVLTGMAPGAGAERRIDVLTGEAFKRAATPAPASVYTAETGFIPRTGLPKASPEARAPRPYVLTPEEAAVELQQLRAMQVGARLRGMKSATRGMKDVLPGEVPDALDELLARRLARREEY